MTRLALGKVVNVNPQGHTVDVVMLDTFDRIPNIQVVAHYVSTASGALSLPAATNPSTQWDVQNTGKTDVLAYVLFVGSLPLVLGFKVPELTQVTFADGRRIDRHDSDVYSSLDQAGNWEKHFPNGLFARIGTSPEHEDLTGQDYDGLWRIAKNIGAELYVTLQMPGGVGGFTIDPQGNIVSNGPNWRHAGQMKLSGNLDVSENVSVGTGASGSFTTPTGQTVTVQDGIVTNIF